MQKMDEKIVTKEEVWAGFAELKEIVAANAKGLAELKQQLAESSRKLDEQLAESSRKANEQITESSRKLDEQIADTNKTVKAVSLQMGGMANSNGDSAEAYFYNALGDTMQFGSQHYDIVEPDVRRTINGVRDQFDIVMYNGTSIAIIEVKYKADLDDFDALVTKKVKNFRAFFPQYSGHQVYLGLGSMSFDAKVIAHARNLGVGILEQKGGVLETDTANMRAY
jgi:hypothetical protein